MDDTKDIRPSKYSRTDTHLVQTVAICTGSVQVYVRWYLSTKRGEQDLSSLTRNYLQLITVTKRS